MRRFCIDSSCLGTHRHIVGDIEGYFWSDSVPRDAWHLTGNIKCNPSVRCLDSLLRLTGRNTPKPPDRFEAAMSHLVSGSNSIAIPWMHVLPQDEFKIFFKRILQETMDSFSELPFDYYELSWMAGNRVLSSLRPAKIDPEAFQKEVDSRGASVPGLESFRPKKSGFAQPVEYDRFSTRTGRFTVAQGPNILLLKKDLRKILKTSFENGRIVSLDFRALEARIVLAESGHYSDADDMYQDVADSIFKGRISRDTVKTAVIAELYGISRSSLKLRLGVPDEDLTAFINAIRDHFKIVELKKRLKSQILSFGKIINRFGRPINLSQGQDNLLVNSYAQSSGVDVSMLGFDSIIRSLGNEGIRPLFVLHDAIILDVRGDRLQEVSSLKSVSIPTYDRPFFLKYDAL